ncbi:hypothetical protein FA13DRAFT_1858453 [Coprinellus micaceus]|uniref:Uncharacterized protein n=1 Tax=Coprinellus micaceus TaxID=71717 RepID=A0A4Y7T7U3_COPMI|nr:hypothetical protein FA13DRAFT_1858453 [Coprinellus micaceus]
MEPFKPEDEALKASRPANDSSDEDATENTSTGEAAGNERLGVYWEAPIPAEQCSAYGMREYHAKLKNLPFFSNGMDVCQNTPIEIHGQSFASPDRCDRRWRLGMVTGYWKVRNQQDCSPQWGRFSQGCIAKGIRLIEAPLPGVTAAEGGFQICTTAPATIKGWRYDHPKSCKERGWFSKLYGQWEVGDPSC